jgi:hypothetical protein
VSGRGIDQATVEALQDTLAVEHAALWCYGLAVAFLVGTQRTRARDDEATHRELRAGLERVLTDAGQRPVSAQPAYATPRPVDDAASAARLLVVAENDAQVAWRSLLEHTADPSLRRAGMTALTRSTIRGARWRTVTGDDPAVPAFPGRP